MKGTEAVKIRNLGIVGHAGSGKTTLTEAMLFTAKAIPRLGTIESGTTTTDFDEDEIRRRMSLASALAFCEWKGCKLNLLDTPGSSLFAADARSCLRVSDAALVVVSALAGVKVHTERVWDWAGRYGLPRVIFISMLDRERADFVKALEDVRKNLCPQAVPIQIPIGTEGGLRGVVDLLRMKALVGTRDGSGEVREEALPSDLEETAKEVRGRLLDAVAEQEDALVEKYLEQGTLTEEEVSAGLRRGVQSGALIPVLCGAPAKAVAVAPLMDFIGGVLPSPVDRGPVEGKETRGEGSLHRTPTEADPFSALVFKTVADPYAGKVTLFRVYSGRLTGDTTVLNSSRGAKERIGPLAFLRGKTQTPAEFIGAGDLGAVVKLKETSTGDTLCDEKTPIVYPPMEIGDPVIDVAIEPKAKGDEEKLSSALARLREEDPTLRVRRDPQTREMILSGMGKVHLEVAVERLKRKFGVEVTLKTPRVPYKESIRARAEAQGRYKKQTGGRGQYGDCWIKIEPLPRGGGYEFVNEVVGGAIPRQYIPAVEKGIVEAMEGGVLAGYPVVDMRVIVYDGSYHTVDSSEMAFKIAGSLAFKKAVQQATPCLLEPIMTVEVTAPDECMGDLIGDLNSKRGRVLGVDARGKNQVIRAHVPLAEMLEYAPHLKAITGDRGEYTMEFAHDEEVPAHISEKIIAASAKGKAKDEEE